MIEFLLNGPMLTPNKITFLFSNLKKINETVKKRI